MVSIFVNFWRAMMMKGGVCLWGRGGGRTNNSIWWSIRFFIYHELSLSNHANILYIQHACRNRSVYWHIWRLFTYTCILYTYITRLSSYSCFYSRLKCLPKAYFTNTPHKNIITESQGKKYSSVFYTKSKRAKAMIDKHCHV